MFHSLTHCLALRPNFFTKIAATASLAFLFICTGNLAAAAQTYAGTNTGAIADGLSGTPPQCGAPRNINFAVSSFNNPIAAVSLNFTLTHTYIGDLQVSLIAPGGTTVSVFSRVGANSAGDFGDNANLGGTYTFADSATQNIWTVAASNNTNAFVIPAGSYRTQAPGPFPTDSPGPAFTSLNATFAAVPANGSWTLRFLDCAAVDTGTVSAANLILTPVAGPTAADASITGRVRTWTGAGVNGAKVTLSGGAASATSVLTNAFGYFIFPAVESGQTYVLSVSSKRYSFAEPVQVVTVNENVAGVDFQALQ